MTNLPNNNFQGRGVHQILNVKVLLRVCQTNFPGGQNQLFLYDKVCQTIIWITEMGGQKKPPLFSEGWFVGEQT